MESPECPRPRSSPLLLGFNSRKPTKLSQWNNQKHTPTDSGRKKGRVIVWNMSREFSTRAHSPGRASLETQPILKKGLAPNPHPTSLPASPQWWQGGDRLKNTCEGGPAEARGRRGLCFNCKIINCFPSPYPQGSSVGTTGHRCKSCIYKLFKKDLCEWSESGK